MKNYYNTYVTLALHLTMSNGVFTYLRVVLHCSSG
jgi:hypothetical protein